MKKIELISDCCNQPVVVKNIWKDDKLVDAYHICSYCKEPCDIVGYVNKKEAEKNGLIVIQ